MSNDKTGEKPVRRLFDFIDFLLYFFFQVLLFEHLFGFTISIQCLFLLTGFLVDISHMFLDIGEKRGHNFTLNKNFDAVDTADYAGLVVPGGVCGKNRSALRCIPAQAPRPETKNDGCSRAVQNRSCG